ncbi:MAG TPA: L-seryl-tRNA(Sec) selenium transferase [Thermodesulforhabdus norvegica]|uniref:L-seryl-tRNA(Sec) selenium transferase n=1 Tax=Thermodesulforhabdus norvegica TaxID=39841 RepID=A0A7C0WVP1_9BACT|nr:L-seryl-tRNA(Sec) selenium transferase [Thermodesulforhabdus norvegica]
MTCHSSKDMLRKLPAVDKLLRHEKVARLKERYPKNILLRATREVIDVRRRCILNGEVVSENDLTVEALADEVQMLVSKKMGWTLKPVVNATGVIVHTNLGRSLLPDSAVERIVAIVRRYNNLEYDLEKGTRGSRYVHAEGLLRDLTGAEAALVVNNNAGAVLLVLNTVAKQREVIVSRGELVEIGGSFRIPEVMAASGAILREVGCTNRTHLSDYANAISRDTIALLKVHKSNYRIVGFSKEVSSAELAELAHLRGLYCLEDMGSGSFVDLSPYGIKNEPIVKAELAAGVDVLTFSGDKLLGGPQAGIIIGRKEIVERCKKNPLTRALRVDKLTLAALEATLKLYLEEPVALEQVPTLSMIARTSDSLKRDAEELASKIRAILPGPYGQDINVDVERCISRVGGGASPDAELPSWAVSLRLANGSVVELEEFLRNCNPPIIVRIDNDRILMDLRTILPGDDKYIAEAIQRFVRSKKL